MKPTAWIRRWALDGEKPVKVAGRWPTKFKLREVSPHQCLPDDEPLYTLAEIGGGEKTPAFPSSQVEWADMLTAGDDYLSRKEQCVVNPVMSCVCNRGTKSCIVSHPKEPK